MTENITAERLQTTTILIITHRPVFYFKHDVSETGFCLYLQVEPTQLGPKERENYSPLAHLSRFHLTTETESSLRNFMFLITYRTMDNVHNCILILIYHRHIPIDLKLQVLRMFETELPRSRTWRLEPSETGDNHESIHLSHSPTNHWYLYVNPTSSSQQRLLKAFPEIWSTHFIFSLDFTSSTK
jgi:hypothetical protein